MKDYVKTRIRKAVPPECNVIPRSTPVVAFGNPETARVATLGLNPSRNEFLGHSGELLKGSERRFETLDSLGRESMENAEDHLLQAVLTACNKYFAGNPYRRWFDQLEIVLGYQGASYYDGTACHLDISQWATNPVWGKLDSGTRQRLSHQDGDFLLQQLASENLNTLLVNGRGVAKQLAAIARLRYQWHPTGLFFGGNEAEIALASHGSVNVIAWNLNFQSSHGVSTELRHEIGRRVAEVLRGA